MNSTGRARKLYLELLREALLDDLYGGQTRVDGAVANKNQVEEGRIWPERAYTMVGRKRLRNFEYAIKTCIDQEIPGDILEAGVWRGGASIYARGVLKAHEVSDRKILVADSFEGLPPPEPDKFPQDRGDKHYKYKVLAVDQESVTENFRRFNLWDEQVLLIPGYFEHSLGNNDQIGPLSVLRADGDMYSSTIQILDSLYHKVSPGGFVIIDDYGAIPACKTAVTDFRKKHDITSPITTVDWTGVYWRKGE